MTQTKHHYRAMFSKGTPPVAERWSACTYTHAWQVYQQVSASRGRFVRGFAGTLKAAETAAQRIKRNWSDGVVEIVTATVVRHGHTIVSDPLAGWTMVQRLRRGQRYQEWTSPGGAVLVHGWPERPGRPWAARIRGQDLVTGAAARVATFASPQAAAQAATQHKPRTRQ